MYAKRFRPGIRSNTTPLRISLSKASVMDILTEDHSDKENATPCKSHRRLDSSLADAVFIFSIAAADSQYFLAIQKKPPHSQEHEHSRPAQQQCSRNTCIRHPQLSDHQTPRQSRQRSLLRPHKVTSTPEPCGQSQVDLLHLGDSCASCPDSTLARSESRLAAHAPQRSRP